MNLQAVVKLQGQILKGMVIIAVFFGIIIVASSGIDTYNFLSKNQQKSIGNGANK
jgi:hypothetical protein